MKLIMKAKWAALLLIIATASVNAFAQPYEAPSRYTAYSSWWGKIVAAMMSLRCASLE